MYTALLHTHNTTRWLVLIAAVAAIALAVVALAGGKPFHKRNRVANTLFVVSMDLQLVIGLALYVVSPLVQNALANMGGAMREHELRFFAVEHLSVMLVAIAVAHVGSVMVRRAESDRAKHLRSIGFFGASLALVLISIPWWRPLFPGA